MHWKKSLIALALGEAFASSAGAQTIDSVAIYGTLDAAVRYQTHAAIAPSGTPVGSNTTLAGGLADGSRLGVRGVEDLGAGNNAHFILEHGLANDSGANVDANAFWNRQAFVGLGGAWGALDAGRQYSVGFKTAVEYDPMRGRYSAIVPIAAMAPGSLGAGCLPLTGQACARFNNDVQYTGTFGALTARAEYAFGEVAGSHAGTAQAVGLRYAHGAASVGASYTSQKTAANFGRKGWVVGAAYGMGPLRLTAGYNDDRTDTATVPLELKTAWGGLSYQHAALLLTGAYYQTKVSSAVSAQRPDGTDKLGVFMLEARYSLSKRTSVYVEYDRSKWARGVLFLPTTTPGATQDAIGLGITQTF